jgi:hypothetical protein
MKKPEIIINKFIFYDLTRTGLKLLNKGKFKTSPWIENIVKKRRFNLKKFKLPIRLTKISVEQLGFNKPTHLEKIYKKALKKNLKLVPPEVAVYSRLIYKKQKVGEWIRFATPLNSMIDTDNVPHLPKFGRALGFYFLETYWSYPKAIFHPKNKFFFMVNDIS